MNKIREGYKVTELGEIPNEWRISALGNICEFKGRIGWRGYTKNDLREYGPLVIGATQISASNKLDFSNPTYLSTEKYEESPEIKVYLNDIILVKTGNTIGKVAIVDKEIGDATINPNTVLLKNITCFNKYLYYIVVSEIIQKPLNKSITVGAQPSVNQETLKKILIPIPTLKEQEKIASILSTVDEQIDNVDALIEKNKELKKGLMQTLLTKGIGYTKFKTTEIGEIPEEWEVNNLGNIVEVISGATPKTNINEYWDNGDIYWATPSDITSNGKYISVTEKKITENGLKNCSAKLLPIGSILMSSRATIGERCINTVPMTTNQGFKSLVCKDGINNEFIYYYVDILKEKLMGLASGSTFLEVSKKVVEDIKVVIPSLEEQEKIASILSEVDKKIDDYENKKQKLEELKKGLMQQLLTGMIRVTV